jgi:ubiquinone/menaquinone biosynthesis C-methylase UbiE
MSKRTDTLVLPPCGSLASGSPVDPLPFYYQPIIGRVYQARMNVGLRCLPDHCDKILDVGYGSGLLMPTLARHARELYGVDIHPRAKDVTEALARLGVKATLSQADARQLPFEAEQFDVVLTFSFLDYVRPVGPYIDEMLRVTKKGGKLLLGIPKANKLFNHLYKLVGYSTVEHLHISSPKDVRDHLQSLSVRFEESGLPRWSPHFFKIYHVFEVFKN